jgi:hypothetical protein
MFIKHYQSTLYTHMANKLFITLNQSTSFVNLLLRLKVLSGPRNEQARLLTRNNMRSIHFICLNKMHKTI